MCVCKPTAMKHYDTSTKRLSDVLPICDALHIDYGVPRHKPITVCTSKAYGRIFEGLCELSEHNAVSLLCALSFQSCLSCIKLHIKSQSFLVLIKVYL